MPYIEDVKAKTKEIMEKGELQEIAVPITNIFKVRVYVYHRPTRGRDKGRAIPVVQREEVIVNFFGRRSL